MPLNQLNQRIQESGIKNQESEKAPESTESKNPRIRNQESASRISEKMRLNQLNQKNQESRIRNQESAFESEVLLLVPFCRK